MEVTAAIKKQRLITTMEETLTSPPLPILSFDLIEEILYRLPVKSLIQFQCVCKSWKSLIFDDPKFAKKHLHMSITFPRQSRHHFNYSLYSSFWDSPISSVFEAATGDNLAQTKLCHPPILNFQPCRVVGSCHGIICFAILDHFVFWNPSVGKFNISQPSLDNYYNRTVYGFGYDHLSDNYKVVVVYCSDSDSYSSDSDSDSSDSGYDDEGFTKTRVKVHTLGIECWRKIHEFPDGVLPFRDSGKFVGGAINWLASKYHRGFYTPFSIVSLDLATESYQEILQPDYGMVDRVNLTLGVLKDCLCIFADCESFNDVWIMKEYGKKESWNKLFTLPSIGGLGFYSDIDVAYMYEDGQVLLASTAWRPKLVVYDYRSDTFKLPEIENISRAIVTTVYVESLISPCGMQTLAVA